MNLTGRAGGCAPLPSPRSPRAPGIPGPKARRGLGGSPSRRRPPTGPGGRGRRRGVGGGDSERPDHGQLRSGPASKPRRPPSRSRPRTEPARGAMGRAIGVSLRPAAGQGRPGSGPGTTRVRREGARRGRAPAIGGSLGSRGRAVPVIRAAPRDGRPEGAGLGRAEAAGLGVPGRAPTYLIGAGCGRSRAGRRDAGWWVGVPRRAGPLAAAGARIGGCRALSGPWPLGARAPRLPIARLWGAGDPLPLAGSPFRSPPWPLSPPA